MTTDNVQNQASGTERSLPEIAKMVITNPAEFYRTMPKTGGFVQPLIFFVVFAVIVAVIQLVVLAVSLGIAGAVAGILSLILTPIFGVIGLFIGGAILMAIWMVMGSKENYETAVRCSAYSYAVAPITTILALIPFGIGAYLSPILGILWGCWLLYQASVNTHGLAEGKSKMVFGGIAVVLILLVVVFAGGGGMPDMSQMPSG